MKFVIAGAARPSVQLRPKPLVQHSLNINENPILGKSLEYT